MTAHSDPAERPILIIGAGRSGTNLLAMALGEVPGHLNAYEQRYVWMKGQWPFGSDIRGAGDATPATTRYIRAHFRRLGKGARVVDKTPSNSLRLPFCHTVFPEAQIIAVLRDPFDNVASRLKEFRSIGQTIPTGHAAADTRRSRFSILTERIAHARRIVARGNVPLGRLPYAVLDQLVETLRIALRGRSERWGERVPGLVDLRRAHNIETAAAHQWHACNTHIRLGSRCLGPNSIMVVAYEDLVHAPELTGAKVATFLGLSDPAPLVNYLVRNANADTVGRYRDRMSAAQAHAISDYLAASDVWGGEKWRG